MPLEKKLLVIIGITGAQGGSVAKVFLEDHPDWRIRGITRDPSKPSSAHLLKAGVELVAADLNNVASLQSAFRDADAIFAVTDFWQFLLPGSSVNVQIEAERRGCPVNELALEKEYANGKNIIDAAAAVHERKPLTRLVISTLSNSKKWSNGKITHNLHFDGKAHYCEYLQETYRTTLGSVTSYVQVGYYLSNALQQGIFKPHLDPHNPGEYLFPTIGVAGGTRPTPFVDTANDVGYFVSALVLKAPPETNVVAYCKEIMFDDFVQLWAETMGLKARSEVWGVNEFVQAGVPLWQAEEMADFGKYVSVWGWSGGDAEVKSPEECGVDMDKLTDVRQWIQEQDWGL